MENVTVTRTFRVALTADQWALYYIEGRDAAARALNQWAEDALNTCTTKGEAAQLIALAQDRYSSFGAADSEGYEVMRALLTVAFPKGESK
jgi:hypothetical protein